MRSLALALVALISVGCSSKPLQSSGSGGRGGGGAGGGVAGSGAFDGGAGTGANASAGTGGPQPAPVIYEVAQEVNRDVDILVVMDNSFGMQNLQASFLANFPTLASILKGIPDGLPNLHLAVVSSDIGAGAFDASDIPNCRHGGDQGIFQNQRRGKSCAAAALAPGERFISNINGQANYTGDLADAFACIAELGNSGCGFEHQLGSMLRALGADGNGGAPAENANFLRPNAYLQVVIVTNEDDCSAPLNSTIFDPASRYVSDPLGPLSSYRCNEYGHVCNGQHPPRTMEADLGATCTSAEDGRLLRIADVANQLKGLKTDPSKVFVSVIAGPTAPYRVRLGAPVLADDPSPWPSIEHSCTTASGGWADPGVRLQELARAFGGNGYFSGDCAGGDRNILNRVVEAVGRKVAYACLEGVPLTAGNRPDCTAVDHLTTDTGVRMDVPLPYCENAGQDVPCWQLNPAASSCRALVTFKRPPASGWVHSTTFTCAGCRANDTRPGCKAL